MSGLSEVVVHRSGRSLGLLSSMGRGTGTTEGTQWRNPQRVQLVTSVSSCTRTITPSFASCTRCPCASSRPIWMDISSPDSLPSSHALVLVRISWMSSSPRWLHVFHWPFAVYRCLRRSYSPLLDLADVLPRFPRPPLPEPASPHLWTPPPAFFHLPQPPPAFSHLPSPSLTFSHFLPPPPVSPYLLLPSPTLPHLPLSPPTPPGLLLRPPCFLPPCPTSSYLSPPIPPPSIVVAHLPPPLPCPVNVLRDPKHPNALTW